MPTVFIILNPIKADKTTRVKKNHFCSIKTDPVLCLIDSVLIFIPFKNHCLSVAIPYNIVNIKIFVSTISKTKTATISAAVPDLVHLVIRPAVIHFSGSGGNQPEVASAR
jgi:hypothetical protein